MSRPLSLAERALEALRGDEEEGFAVMPSLAEDLAARVGGLDPLTLEVELDALRAFCDMMLGRGATAVAEVIIEAVGSALDQRPASVVESTVPVAQHARVMGTAPVARRPVPGDRRGGGALLALRSAPAAR